MFEFLIGTKWGNFLYLLIISMMPVVELRLAIPAGAANNVPWLECYLTCVVGNMIPVPFLLLFSEMIFRWLEKTIFKNLVAKIRSRVDKKKGQIDQIRKWGLILFTLVPLPGTGAWMASLVATATRVPFKQAFFCILVGVLGAGVIVTAASYGFFALF